MYQKGTEINAKKAHRKEKRIRFSLYRPLLSVICAFLICITLADAAHARQIYDTGQAYKAERTSERPVSIFVNGQRYTGKAFLSKSTTYVGLREFSMYMGADSVTWLSDTKTAQVSANNLSLIAKAGALYISANGRYLWAGSGVMIKSGTMYVPLRTVAKAFGGTVSWNSSQFAAYVTKGEAIEPGSAFYDNTDLYWLSRIIHAEAGGESLLGKVAVGTVVLNRKSSPEFPNTVHGVIFDTKNGVQFTPTANGAINCIPSEESIIAAKLCLDGASISDKALFFINEALAQSSWVSDNRPFIVAVGNHNFYA